MKTQRFVTLLAIFLAINLYASSVNHIDDTDETYGYWEVLHYLMYGHGTQTWEYAPQYAIRTYAFIAPFWMWGHFLRNIFNLVKIDVFYSVRILLGALTAYSEASFVSAIGDKIGENEMYFTVLFLIFSPGIFLSSTAFLPSAVAMSLIMLSCASWLRGANLMAIFFGCIAVLATGWPFVAVLFIPLGLHMIVTAAAASGVLGICRLITMGVFILCVVGGFSTTIDIYMYGKVTSPSLNILLYNALGGTGDELYGVEPASYYVRNLFLNMGLAWPLALAAPLLLLKKFLESYSAATSASRLIDSEVRGAVLCAPAIIWLGLLFRRPHKEERFMYPIYPLLAFMGALSVLCFVDLVVGLVAAALREKNPDSLAALSSSRVVGAAAGNRTSHDGHPRRTFSRSIQRLALLCVAAATAALGLSRTASNVFNFGGYIALWGDVGTYISSNSDLQSKASEGHIISVCTGGDWFRFPSHFFLPDVARIAFVRDTFHGQLPAHFSRINGTSCEPQSPFNDKNEEEMSRYVALTSCDLVVTVVHPVLKEEDMTPLLSQMLASERNGASFAKALQRDVLDASRSTSALFRAFYVPGMSSVRNRFNSYTAFLKR